MQEELKKQDERMAELQNTLAKLMQQMGKPEDQTPGDPAETAQAQAEEATPPAPITSGGEP